MPTVAIRAARDVGVFACYYTPVAIVDFGDVRVTPGAINRSDRVLMRESCNIGMAVDTLKAGMGRAAQQLA